MKNFWFVVLLGVSLAACSAGSTGDNPRPSDTIGDTGGGGTGDDGDGGSNDDPAALSLTEVHPSTAEWQDTLTLRGTFGAAQNGGTVTIGTQAVSVVSWSNTTLTVTLPDGLEPGANDVTLSRGDQKTKPVKITVKPTLDTVESPVVVGSAVRITGANLGVPAGSVQISGPAAATLTIQSWSGGAVHVGVPTGLKSGLFTLTLAKNGVSATGALTIANSPPSVASVSVGEGPYTKSVIITATPQGTTEPNGDTVSYLYRWFHNGTLLAAETSDKLSLAAFSAGDTVAVTVQPFDGYAYGAAVMPGAITISNALPGAPAVDFTPAMVTATTGLTATPSASDGDGDALTYTFAWSRNGEAMAFPATMASLPSYLVNPGEEWKVVVTPSDGYASGPTGWAQTKINVFPRLTAFITGSGAAGTSRQVQGSGFSTPISAAAGGAWFTCALQTTGGVTCWGSQNASGQVGDGTWAEPKNRASAVLDANSTALAGAIAIDSGASHTCALMSNGTVKCWGENGSGQLGDGTQIDRNKATTVLLGGNPLSGVIAITAGGGHSCALMAQNRTVKCWGSRQYGQLGDGTDDQNGFSPRLAPVDVVGADGNPLAGVAELSAGAEHTCAVMQTGALQCWGSNGYFALGRGWENSNQTQPVAVLDGGSAMTGVASVSANLEGTCAVLLDRRLKCWGLNWYGQVGDGTKTIREYPAFVLSGTGHLTGVTAVAAGQEHTCALMSTGGVKCWGDGSNYKLGTGTLSEQLKPADVTTSFAPAKGNIAVATGSFSSCALGGFGYLQCWGADGSGVPVYRNAHGQVKIKFGGVTATYTGGWDNTVSFTVPALPSGTYPVYLIVDGVASNTLSFAIP